MTPCLPQVLSLLRAVTMLALCSTTAIAAELDATNAPAASVASVTNAAAPAVSSGATNLIGSLSMPGADAGAALVRVLGALALVIALFLGGVWLFRNWQRLAHRTGQPPRLNVVEVRSLGGRHALYVIGYEQERFLISSTPAGINLLTHLPAAEPATPGAEQSPAAPPSFAQALSQVLKGGQKTQLPGGPKA